MGPGGIATIIASVSLLVLALAIGFTVIRISRLIDEVQKTVRSVNRIATTAEKATEKVNDALATLVGKNSSILKLITGAASSFMGRKHGSSKAFAVIIAAGLEGIAGNYELTENADPEALPMNLDEAIRAMESSALVRTTLGEPVFEYVLRNKRAEWTDYSKQVSAYEIDRYLPIL